jgi:starvation-inducible outer membrane lipoprotein
MPSVPRYKLIGSGIMVVWLLGCAATIPPQLADQVAWQLSFRDIRRHPEVFTGRVVALGGVVTQIEAAADGARLTVLEFPLDGSSRHRPAANQPSDGTFQVQAVNGELPEGLRPGAEITVVGEVLGKSPWTHGGNTEDVPLLAERYIRVWGPSWWPHLHIGIWGSTGL